MRMTKCVRVYTVHVYTNILPQLKGMILIVGTKETTNKEAKRKKGQANKKSDSAHNKHTIRIQKQKNNYQQNKQA